MNKSDLQEKTKENIKNARKLEEKLKEAFEKVIDDPSEKKIKKYKEVEEVLLIAWLDVTLSNLFNGINESVKSGKSLAIAQLRAKKFKKEIDNKDIYSRIANAKKQQIKADLEKVVAGIKANSRSKIAQLQDAIVLQKKKLSKGFYSSFKKFGIGYFLDASNRRWRLENYIEMATNTVLLQVERQAYFAKSEEWGNDLVRVVHTVDEEPCPLCEPFKNKVLSITGKTRGFMSVADAQSFGLFHINCYDVLELAPNNPEKHADIQIDEANSKFNAKYNR